MNNERRTRFLKILETMTDPEQIQLVLFAAILDDDVELVRQSIDKGALPNAYMTSFIARSLLDMGYGLPGFLDSLID